MSRASLDPIPKFSSDLIAWEASQGYVESDANIPMADIRWGEAATAGACTWFHIASNGFGNEIRLKCGKRILIFIQDQHGEFIIINAFNKFELDRPGHNKIEVVLLMPGTRLYVLQIHLVFNSCIENIQQGDKAKYGARRVCTGAFHLPWWEFLLDIDNARYPSRFDPQFCGPRQDRKHQSFICRRPSSSNGSVLPRRPRGSQDV